MLPLVAETSDEAAAAASSSSPGTAAGSGLKSGSCLAGAVLRQGLYERDEGNRHYIWSLKMPPSMF